ncbi:MAG: ABC transporter permease, partial [Acidimicrobiales bacterium]
MFRLTLTSLWARKRRLVGTSVAVAIGVAFLTGTLVLGDTLSANFRDLFNDVSANTDVVVRSSTVVEAKGATDANRGLIDESIIETVRNVDGVGDVEGKVVGYGSLYGSDGEPIGGNGPPRQAGSWITSPDLNPYKLVEGRAPELPNEVVINRGAAKAGGLHLGDTTVVQTPEPVEVTIVGIATFGDTDGLGQTTWTAFTLRDAQDAVMHQPGKVSSILVTAADGVSSVELRDRIAAVVPANTEAITGKALADERIDDIAKTFLNLLRTFLVVFALIALAVATLSINNTFAITIAQRTRELALLRAVGASRRQVRGAVTLEALAIGGVSGLVGLVGGLGIAGLLKGLFDAFGGALPAGGMAIRPQSLAIGLAAGVVVTLLAAQAPARRASVIAPVAALRDADVEPSRPSRRRYISAAALLAAGEHEPCVAGCPAGDRRLARSVGRHVCRSPSRAPRGACRDSRRDRNAVTTTPQHRERLHPGLPIAQRRPGSLQRRHHQSTVRVAVPERVRHEDRLDVIDRGGAGEVEALHPIAAGDAQDLELANVLHSFGHDLHAQRVREGRDRVDDRRCLVIVLELADERPVDLDRVDGKVAQVADRRVTGAEVVDGDLDAEFLERAELSQRSRIVVDESRLGDLESDRRWVDVRRLERLAYALRKVGLVELAPGDIDRHTQRRKLGALMPELVLPARV